MAGRGRAHEKLGPDGRKAFEKVGKIYDATNSAAQEIIDVAATLGELTGLDEVQGEVAELLVHLITMSPILVIVWAQCPELCD